MQFVPRNKHTPSPLQVQILFVFRLVGTHKYTVWAENNVGYGTVLCSERETALCVWPAHTVRVVCKGDYLLWCMWH
jgi:hypothetical protein